MANPTILLDSLILVTAANGLVASHITDQLLVVGYRVRGTIRNKTKNAWMISLFNDRYGSDRFELVEIPDASVPGVWDGVVKGVAVIAHVLGTIDVMTPNGEKAAEEELPWHLALLNAAQNEPTVKSFIYTSSAWAAWAPDASKKITLTEWTWNETAVELARSDASPEEKGLFAQYMALKAILEQKVWEWVNREKPSFTFNTILLDTVIGDTLQPKELGIPSTAAMVKWAVDGINLPILNGFQPQWYVNTRDAALLYVAAFTVPGVDRERLFAFGDRFSWPRIVEILGQLFLEKKLQADPDSPYSVANSNNVSIADTIGEEHKPRPGIGRYLLSEIDTSWTDTTVIICGFVSGLVDGLSFTYWNSFSDMKTGTSLTPQGRGMSSVTAQRLNARQTAPTYQTMPYKQYGQTRA